MDLAGRTLDNGEPAFLFRGERGFHSTTYSSVDRFYHSQKKRERDAHDDLEKVTAFCMKEPLRNRGLAPKFAAAFAQHYGLPTHIFDFTASPEVAINFAANRPRHAKKLERIGQIAVLDVVEANNSGRATLLDLRRFSAAIRARRQEAFGLIYSSFVENDHVDIKREEIAKPIGLNWCSFAHLPDDETYLHLVRADADLESLEGDGALGIPQDMIDRYVLRNGPLSRNAAKILSRHVPALGRFSRQNELRWSAYTDTE